MSKAKYEFFLTLYRALMMLAKGLKAYIDNEAKENPTLTLED